jgi:membrane protease YdiL (CAAX protease family)
MSAYSSLGEPLPVPPVPSTGRKIFFGPSGIRSGWRLLLFLGIFAALQFAFRAVIIRMPAVRQFFNEAKSGTLSPQFEFVFETSVIVMMFLATAVMGHIERRSLADYGLPSKGAFGKLFWKGAAWGLTMETLIILGISAFHGFSFGSLALSGGELVKYALMWAGAFVLVGIFEEFLFRGYAQFTLASGIGFWPAAIVFSALFGAVHLSNSGEGWVGALSVMLFGLFACLTLKRTGSLWFAVGLHAAGDYAETFLYSVPDSGLLAKGHLLNSTMHGARWLTGGTIGPEGSIMDFVVFLLAFALFAWLYPAKEPQQAALVSNPEVQPHTV